MENSAKRKRDVDKLQIFKGRIRMRLGVKERLQSRNKDGIGIRIVQERQKCLVQMTEPAW